jgi:S-adenosylmethionine synthetase
MMKNFVFTSESVTAAHPDKLCDRISDEIIDRYLWQDPGARVRAEAAVSSGVLFLAVRFASTAYVDISEVAREVLRQVGYTEGEFNANDCTIMTNLTSLPPERLAPMNIEALPEERLESITSSNQATVFGFACKQTPDFMPLPILLAHALARRLSEVAARGDLPYLLMDGKTQVGVEFIDRRPARIHSITLVACQSKAGNPTPKAFQDDLRQMVIDPVFTDQEIKPDSSTQILVNPDGPLVGGGPMFHSGLTGRKTAMDSYGDYARHGGNALSGKDPLRIDRTGAYVARHVAKQVVAAGLAEQCELQLSYSIGHARPVSVQIDTQGSAKIAELEILNRIRETFDFRLASTIRRYRLQTLPAKRGSQGFYAPLSVYGHFGRPDLELPWERLDYVDDLA